MVGRTCQGSVFELLARRFYLMLGSTIGVRQRNQCVVPGLDLGCDDRCAVPLEVRVLGGGFVGPSTKQGPSIA